MPQTSDAGPQPGDDWITKEQAAARLGCSIKTIERYETRGLLGRADRPMAGRKPIPVYNPGDLDRLSRVSLSPAVTQSLAVAETPQEPNVAQEQFLKRFLDQMQKSAQPRTPLHHKMYLTLREASEFSGLPQTMIRQLAKDNKIESLLTGAGWRYRRSSLEEL